MAGASLFFDIFARDNNVSDTLDRVGRRAQETQSRTEKLGGALSGFVPLLSR